MTKANPVEKQHDRDALTHWAWVLLILLIVAALSMRQIDLYPPTPDEFFSMYNAGWLVDGPYSPLEVMQSLYNNSPNHTPGYFIVLSLWGNLTSYDVAIGRVLGVFFGLLSLVIAYRLARDFVAPVAGLFAIIIVASNAFYSFYIPHVRMYSLLLFMSGVVLWIYLRIVHRSRTAQYRDFLALGVAVFLLVNTHAFSVTFLSTLAIYHVLVVPKNRNWQLVIIAVISAILVFAPWTLVLIFQGIERTGEHWGEARAGSWDIISAWLKLTTNGQPLLLALSIAGLALAASKTRSLPNVTLLLIVPYLILLGLLTDATTLLRVSGMRYLLSGWFFLILLLVAGLVGLYRYRKWMGVLVLLWVAAGASFQANVEWRDYIAGRRFSFLNPPWQAVSALAVQVERSPHIVGYRTDKGLVEWPSYVNYSQREHYFDRKGIGFHIVNDPHEFGLYMRHDALILPEVWIVLQTSVASLDENIELQTTMKNLDYQLCGRAEVGVDAVILKHSWSVLDCGVLELQSGSRSELVDYRYFGSKVDAEESKLLFIDAWSAQADVELDNYLMSYQLISPDWDNVAQLDLPLVREGVARRFSIDVAGVPAGSYRLMAILYDKATGERVTWIDNDGELPYMLTLAEIEIRDED